MRKISKILAIICATSMMLTFTACGSAEDNSTDAASSEAVETEQSEVDATKDSTSEDGASEETSSEETTASEKTAEATPEPETIQRLVKETYYKEDGSFSYQYVYEYDEAGNRIKKTTLNDAGEVTGYYAYEYNEHNLQTLSGSYSPDGTPNASYRETIYNAEGVIIQYTQYHADGTIGSQKIYNDNGDIIEYIANQSDGTLYEKTLYTYDENRRVIREDYINPDFTSSNTFTYSTDASGNLLKQYYSDDGDLYRTETYDANGNLLKEESPSGSWGDYEYTATGKLAKVIFYDTNGVFASGTEYTYNENDDIMKEVELNDDGTPLAWVEYTYDDHGRLTKKFKNDIMDFGLVEFNSSYEYNENETLLKKIDYTSDDQIKGWTEYEYEEVVVTE